jgi:hypothetical protein
MPEIAVELVNIATGEHVQGDVPDDSKVRDLNRAIAEQLGLPPEPGGANVYTLTYKGPGPTYTFNADDTLASRGIKPGSILGIAKEFIAG